MSPTKLSRVGLAGHPDWIEFEEVLAKLTAGRMYGEDLRIEGAPIDERRHVAYQLLALRQEIQPLRTKCTVLSDQIKGKRVSDPPPRRWFRF